MFYRFVRKILGNQVQLTGSFAQPIQNHRHHRCSDAHIPAIFSCLRVKPCCYPRFSTYPSTLPKWSNRSVWYSILLDIFLTRLLFPYLTENPFSRQPFCGMWATAHVIV